MMLLGYKAIADITNQPSDARGLLGLTKTITAKIINQPGYARVFSVITKAIATNMTNDQQKNEQVKVVLGW